MNINNRVNLSSLSEKLTESSRCICITHCAWYILQNNSLKPNNCEVLGFIMKTLCNKSTSFSPMTHVSARKQTVLVPWKDSEFEAFLSNPQPHAGGLCSASLSQNKVFQAHSLRDWYHRGAHLSHRHSVSQCFPNRWGKMDTVPLRSNASRKNSSTVK